MNRKVKSFTILITGLLVASICFSALSQGALLSDQLIVTEGSYVKGKYLYTNSTHNDVLMAYMTLSVDEIWNDTNTLLNLVNFKVLYEFQADGENPLGADDMTIMEITASVFEHNRTTFLPAATLMMRNATWEASVDIFYLKDTAGMMDFNKANITIDGVSYLWEDMDGSETNYSDYFGMIFSFAIINAVLLSYNAYTPYAVNPHGNVADTVSFEPSNGVVDEFEPITTTQGDAYDCMNVEYINTATFGLDDVGEVDTHYELKTGLLIRSLEKDTSGSTQMEFQPIEVVIKSAFFLPFPFVGVLVSFVAIGLVVVLARKRK
ncbi:MAG: hypothetical protein H7647_07830 [Candidatus Heimdallarchaeota archaeon]|nr:hypothetical protein [Candidatus Heimdallarchaeota archaeon]MCK4254335.1 hypothetical protein [Candidatus Heimdallarchaeota archaeon]